MKVNLGMLIIQIIGMFVVFALALFLAAGTIFWLAGWAFLLLFFTFTIVLSWWLLKHNPALLTERMTGIGKQDQKSWDKVFFVVANILFLGWLVLMPLDAVRFQWSSMPWIIQVFGAFLLLVSFYCFFRVFRENSFLSPAVRIQREREQTVIATGPYSVVRHPMYAAALMLFVGTTLLLGSWYGFVLALILTIAMAMRALQEERELQAALPGYDAYMAKVRYHLIPYVW